MYTNINDEMWYEDDGIPPSLSLSMLEIRRRLHAHKVVLLVPFPAQRPHRRVTV